MADMGLDLLVDMDMDLDNAVTLDMDIYSDSAIDMEVDREGGGTNDYNALVNKPQIEGVTLKGNRTFRQLGLESMTEQDIDNILFG